ncbi:uncharacterized protein LOC108914537 isoform X1 [Anoplophora glabripennis]|uniref:uncharacterized protein LOC108914537 isoform X1 n=1 Tax=Anoplophora glabripennis TaxID=217634 RepID=UPI000875A754|nr:uncharacterized protein LOC108914537 isoform X1 [Anoplophora glabripennis]
MNICEFEYGETCTNVDSGSWRLKNSTDGEINDFITDRRWEELPVYKSKDLNRHKTTLAFEEVTDTVITKTNFVIPFSVRLNNEGHIFLCEDYVTNSNCYWIMLGAWKGRKSVIRRCGKGEIPYKDKMYPTEPCSIPRAIFNHGHDIISDKFWTHFKIIMKNNTIAVRRGNEDMQLLEFKDDKPFSPRRIFVHSKSNIGLWKFHTYTYIYTTSEDEFADLNISIIPFSKRLNCVALFLAMCRKCQLSVYLKYGYNREHLQTFTATDEKWKQVKLFFKLDERKIFQLRLYFYTQDVFTSASHKLFWAIDSLRQCEDNEYRILPSSIDHAPCQFFANNYSVSIDATEEITDLKRKCPENTFGENCVPCTVIGGNVCPPLKYCELIENKTSCYCTPGFHGPSCDNAIVPLLKYALKVINTKETSCEVYIDNYEIIGDRFSFNYIQVQYKENSSDKWISHNETSFSAIQSLREKISNLEADTTYCVRAVLYSNKSNFYQGHIKETCFNTTCIPYKPDDIIITTSDTSATVELLKKSESCQTSKYKYSLDADKERKMEDVIVLTDLQPLQMYTFNLRHVVHGNISIKFQVTTEKPPYNVIVTWTHDKDMNISWNNPNITKWKIKKFSVNIVSDHTIIFSRISKDLECTCLIEKKYFKPCRKYDVSVAIYSEKYSRTYNIEKWSAPPVPDISEDAIKISHTNNIIVIYIPRPTNLEQNLRNCSRKLHILKSLWQNNEHINKTINDFEHALKNSLPLPTFNNVRRIYEINEENLPFEFPIKDDSVTKYRLHLLFINECFGQVQLRRIQKDLYPGERVTLGNENLEGIDIANYVFLVSMLLLPSIPFMFIFAMIWKHEIKGNCSKKTKQPNKDIEEIPLSDINEPQPSTSTAQLRY